MKIVGPRLKKEDRPRQETQMTRILAIMLDGQWRTWMDVSRLTGISDQVVGSQLRNLKLTENGGFIVEPRANPEGGYDQYRLTRPTYDRQYYNDNLIRRQGIFEEAKGRYIHARQELQRAKRDLQNYDTPQGDLFHGQGLAGG